MEEDAEEDQLIEDMTEETAVDTTADPNAASRRGPPHPHVATNDGTHRLTIQWTAPTDVAEYENDKQKCNLAIHTLVSVLFLDEDGVLFRWESEDLTISKAASSLNQTDMRDFITPTATFLKSRCQMLSEFALGFCLIRSSGNSPNVSKAS